MKTVNIVNPAIQPRVNLVNPVMQPRINLVNPVMQPAYTNPMLSMPMHQYNPNVIQSGPTIFVSGKVGIAIFIFILVIAILTFIYNIYWPKNEPFTTNQKEKRKKKQ
jgi:hypothetical protein